MRAIRRPFPTTAVAAGATLRTPTARVEYGRITSGRAAHRRSPRPLPKAPTGIAGLPASASALTGGTEVVLLVDDEPALRSVTARLLTRAGFHVLSAGGAEEAMGLLAAHTGRLDLLLTDVVMPGTSGPGLVELVRRVRPGIKVLYMSGYTDDTVLRHGVNSHHVHFIDKPFSLQTLAAKVRACLDADAAP